MNTALPVPVLPGPILCDTEHSLVRLLQSLLLLTLLADVLFFQRPAGISVAIFAACLLTTVLWQRQPFDATRWILLCSALLVPTLVQSAIELSSLNLLVVFTLLIVVSGDSFYTLTLPRWIRWASAFSGLLTAPARWFWLTKTGPAQAPTPGAFHAWRRNTAWLVRVLFPALLLTTFFSLLLGSGNVILKQHLQHWLNRIADILRFWELLSLDRLCFWLWSSTLILAILRPTNTTRPHGMWNPQPPKLLTPDAAQLHIWRSHATLILLNGLFVAANGIDALYLWMNISLPPGVTHSRFVHEGVYQLIATVVISGLVLTNLFRTTDRRAATTGLKVMALVWVVQNVFLVASVALRLKLYVEAYQLSLLRVGVALFLLVVVMGFGLLTIKILFNRPIRWLLGANAVATFTLFYALQFLNIAGFVAGYNLAAWERNPSHALDIAYLVELGPPAWPALIQAAHQQQDPYLALEAKVKLREALSAEEKRMADLSWPSWQWQRHRMAGQLRHDLLNLGITP